jgi:TatA/E family protein of Tat protein translocase
MPTMPGPMELLIIAALALIVFGPARLPEIARSIGKAVNEFRRQASDLKSEFDLSLDEEPPTGSKPGGVRAEKNDKPSQDPDPDPEPNPPASVDPDPSVPAAPDESAPDKS